MAGLPRYVRRAFVVALLIVGALALVAASQAVVGGVPDGDQHPNVGLIEGLDAYGNLLYFCTGTLVDPTTVLTAAHCVGGDDFGAPIAQIIVDFDSQLPQRPDGSYYVNHFVTGTGDYPSAFQDLATVQSTSAFRANAPYDVGLVHLSAPAASVFPGIQPAPITDPGTNDRYLDGPDKTLVLQVGYGYQREGPHGRSTPYLTDFTRNQSLITPRTVTDGVLLFKGNPNDAIGYGSPCFGDSGSPAFRDGLVIAVITAGGPNCQNAVLGPRLDAGPARDFLRSRGLVP